VYDGFQQGALAHAVLPDQEGHWRVELQPPEVLQSRNGERELSPVRLREFGRYVGVFEEEVHGLSRLE